MLAGQTMTPTLPQLKKKPRLILGLNRSDVSAALEAQFRTLGWDVTQVPASEVSRAIQRPKAAAIVLSLNTDGESGLLACAKIRLVHPQARILIVGPESTRYSRYARFAGAAGYLPQTVAVPALTRAILGN